MASSVLSGVKITGLACAVPSHVDSIYDFSDSFGLENVEKFIATTGVRERRFVSDNQTNSDLCYEAAEKIIAHKGYDKSSFDAIVLVTQTPDYARPATAHVLHARLGLSKDCAAFDINLGCSGFVYGVQIVSSMVIAGGMKRVLLCCGEAHTCLSPTDNKATSMLFGDAGSAMIIEAGDDTMHCLLKADGKGYQTILTPGINARIKVDLNNLEYDDIKETMDGSGVFEFSIIQVPKAFKEFFKTFECSIDEYDYCVFHQANLFMLEHIRKKIKLPVEKMPISMDRYGNTSSVSIPITIADLCSRENTKDEIKFICSGFGIGLSWGVLDFTMNKEDILPVIETDNYFKEAYTGK